MDVGGQQVPAEAHGGPAADHNWLAGRCATGTETLPYWLDVAADPSCGYFFCRLLSDHNAIPQYLNVLSTEPTTVPQGTFFSSMTVLSFKSWDMRQAFIQKYGGGSGTPLYLSEDQPMRGHHIKVVPNSPQLQRKLESPIRVILAAMNNTADHNPDNKRFVILRKSLTIMEPMDQDAGFKEDARAWARIFYQNKDGEFEGRLEVVPELNRILLSGPENVDAAEGDALGREVGQWGQVQWGPQRELDEADKVAFGTALQQSKGSGKGVSYKGNRHWSAPMVHSSYYAPFPFEFNIVEVGHIAFSWDEYCTKCGATQHMVGDVAVCTHQASPAL